MGRQETAGWDQRRDPLAQSTLPWPGRSQTLSGWGNFKTCEELVRTSPVVSKIGPSLLFTVKLFHVTLSLFLSAFSLTQSFAGWGYF